MSGKEAEPEQQPEAASSSSKSARVAPSYELPPTFPQLVGIEFPGPIRSITRALEAVGGIERVSHVLSTPETPSKSIDFNLNPNNRFFHPVPGTILDSGNVVLKVTKRRRKKPKVGADGKEEVGVYTIEPAGIATKTVRFRVLADFQFAPDQTPDPIYDIADRIRDMDVDAIRQFTMPPPDENFRDAQVLPPPIFTRSTVPAVYDYKPASSTVPVTSLKPSGEEVTRLVNVTRYTGKPVTTIAFSDETVPQGPSEDVSQLKGKDRDKEGMEALEKKMLGFLEMRPVWTRAGLINQLPAEEVKTVLNNKTVLPRVAYSFSDGPFRDLIVRFGYDPRIDPEARFYQHLVFRNTDNVRKKATAVNPSDKGKAKETFDHDSHMFDGKTAHSKVGNFQLCDISDPLSKQLIESTAGVVAKCSIESEGWYDPDYYDQIRQVVRRKFMGYHSGIVVSDLDCEDLLGDPRKKGREKTVARGRSGSGASASGSASGSGASAGHGGGESDEGTPSEQASTVQMRARAKAKVKAHPWQTKKKGNKAKRPAGEETEEERALRLRQAIGLGSGFRKVGGPSEMEVDEEADGVGASGSGSASGSEEDEEEEEE